MRSHRKPACWVGLHVVEKSPPVHRMRHGRMGEGWRVDSISSGRLGLPRAEYSAFGRRGRGSVSSQDGWRGVHRRGSEPADGPALGGVNKPDAFTRMNAGPRNRVRSRHGSCRVIMRRGLAAGRGDADVGPATSGPAARELAARTECAYQGFASFDPRRIGYWESAGPGLSKQSA